jgi:GDP-mannose 6-dehydrogenase
MKISIFGLGYVGRQRAQGQLHERRDSPIIEPDLQELIRKTRAAKTLRATLEYETAILETDLSVICVGTPSLPNGSINLDTLRLVIQQVGKVLKQKSTLHTVVVRSTILPGTFRNELCPALERSSAKKCGRDLMVSFNPEFLREGSAIRDFMNPPFIIVGSEHESAFAAVEQMYSFLSIPVIRVDPSVAEMVKYACNLFHGLKITFANEIGAVCNHAGIDPFRVMELLCQDTDLNISGKYLKPGFAFGGSCLPKDLQAILHYCRQNDVEVPLIRAIDTSNQTQIDRCVELVLATGQRNVTVLGLSFKAGTDDLRESPAVKVVKRLIGEGLNVAIYDRNIMTARLIGTNKQYIEEKLPHVSTLLKDDLKKTIDESTLIIITHATEEFRRIRSYVDSRHKVIDLPGLFRDDSEMKERIIPLT